MLEKWRLFNQAHSAASIKFIESHLCGPGDDHDVGHVGRELGEEGDVDDLPDPLADGLDQFGVLAARQSHASLAHAVRAGEVELEGVGTGLGGHLGELLPVGLVEGAHDRGDDYAVREVRLELTDAPGERSPLQKNRLAVTLVFMGSQNPISSLKIPEIGILLHLRLLPRNRFTQELRI